MKVILSTALLLSASASSSVVPLPKLTKEDVRRLHQGQISRSSMLEDGGIAMTARSAAARKLAISDNSVLTVAAADGSMNPITLTHSDALFGLPLHGATLTASLNSMLINSGTDAAKGCNPGDYSSVLRGQVILVERGNCSFAQKVLNAQNYGDARAVIVVDTYYLCGIDTEICDGQAGCGGCEEGFQPSSPLCMCTLNFMSADQSQLNQLDIPAMMITKRDGARLKTLAETGVALIASMSWDLPERNGAAELTLWGQSQDVYTAQFRESFAPYLPYLLGAGLGSGLEKLPAQIVPRLAFTPHQYIFDGRSIGCGTYFDCGSSCVNNGRYCSYDSGDENNQITGAAVVTEALRDICVWQWLSSKATGNPPQISPSATPSASMLPSSGASVPPPAPAPSHLPLGYASATISYWSYIELVTNNCGTTALYGTQDCSQAQMGLINVAANGDYPSPSPRPNGPVPSARPAPGEWTLRPEFLESGIPFMGIDELAVVDCMFNSNAGYNATGDKWTYNTLLQPELEALQELNLYQLPTLIINDVLLRGGVTAKAALIGLCNSYGSQLVLPLVCSCIDVPFEQLQQCISATAGNSDSGNTGGNGFVPADHGQGLPKWADALIAFVVLGTICTIGVVYYLQRRSAQRVEEALDSHYRSLSTGMTDDDRLTLIEQINNSPAEQQRKSKVRASSAARQREQASLVSRLQQLARVGPHAARDAAAANGEPSLAGNPYLDNNSPPNASAFSSTGTGGAAAEMRTFGGSSSNGASSSHHI